MHLSLYIIGYGLLIKKKNNLQQHSLSWKTPTEYSILTQVTVTANFTF